APANDPPAQKRSAAPFVAVAALLVAGATGAVVWATRTPAAAPESATAEPTTTTTQAAQPPAVVTPKQPDAPKPAEVEEVIVDSVPPGAKIVVDGVAVAETPEAIKVDKGKTKLVVIKKDGFVDQEQTIDPQKTHKLLVKLEHVKRAAATPKGGKPSKLPAPPPSSIDPPAKAPTPPAVVAQPKQTTPVGQPPKKKKPIDPYERVDESSPKKSNDVLNPY
ncbi:MAG: hypothetical protein JWM53_3806, partial [bacterium]|nr:hypothetical protein [bacterium]